MTTKVYCQSNYIDPTGTYELDSKAEKKGEDIFGYFEKIQVKTIQQDKIVMTFMICKFKKLSSSKLLLKDPMADENIH